LPVDPSAGVEPVGYPLTTGALLPPIPRALLLRADEVIQ
jgi:hypothetical protein